MTIPEPPEPDAPADPDVPHPGPADPRGPRPDGPPVEPPMRPLEPYDPDDPSAPRPGTRAALIRGRRAGSSYDFGTLDALRQLRELFPGNRILLDLDSRAPELIVTVESPPSIIVRTEDSHTSRPAAASR
mgnify:CR=1 FL=1